MRKAVVVFSGRVDKAWQRLLKPGFKHCSLIIEDGPSWLLIEPLCSCLQVRAIGRCRRILRPACATLVLPLRKQ